MTAPASVLAILVGAACSPSDVPPPIGDTPAPLDGGFDAQADRATLDRTDGASAEEPEADGSELPGDTSVLPSFGELAIVDIPDVPCIPSRASATLLSDDPAAAGGFDVVGHLGASRFAFTRTGSMTVTFTYDGTSVSPPTMGPLAVAEQNATLQALIANEGSLQLQTYDAQNQPMGAALPIEGSLMAGLALSAGPTASLATWCSATEVLGRVIDSEHRSGAPLKLFARAGGDRGCRTASLWNGTNFSLLWTRRLQDGATQTSMAFVDINGVSLLGKNVVLARGGHSVVDLARTPSGYLVLSEESEGEGRPVVIRLDAFGNVIAPAIRLGGTRRAFSIAPFGEQFMVGALLEGGRAAVRAFDVMALPLGPWVCVDDRLSDMPLAGHVAVGPDDQGYAVVARMSDGASWYMRTNHLGDDSP